MYIGNINIFYDEGLDLDSSETGTGDIDIPLPSGEHQELDDPTELDEALMILTDTTDTAFDIMRDNPPLWILLVASLVLVGMKIFKRAKKTARS